MNEWIKAGLLLAGFVVAIILAVHVIGGAHAAPSPTASANGTQTPGSGGNSGGPSGGYTPPVVDTAQALGISPATLLADIQSGETVPQIAQAQNVALATVNAAYLRGVQEQIAQLEQQGGRGNPDLYQREQQQVQNGQYDMLRSQNSQTVGG
jgi:hypothetical protein